jgi:hypothetical protein
MRLKSDIFAAALVRRVYGAGGFAAIERRGAEEAGALFIRVRHRDGTQSLFAPAPQSVFDTGTPADRVFEARLERVPDEAMDDALQRELRFDGDLWIVEIEVDDPQTYLTIAGD